MNEIDNDINQLVRDLTLDTYKLKNLTNELELRKKQSLELEERKAEYNYLSSITTSICNKIIRDIENDEQMKNQGQGIVIVNNFLDKNLDEIEQKLELINGQQTICNKKINKIKEQIREILLL